MNFFTKIVAVFGLLLFYTGAFADSQSGTASDSLDAAGVNYIRSTNGTLIILKTKKTAEAVDSLNLEGADVVDYAESFEEAAVQREREARLAERNK